MKTRIIIPILALLIAAGTAMKAQEYSNEYLGLPGDNLNLYAVMKLFQESKTLEGFEKDLNDEKNKINNLDLNRDNYVDYIMVIDNVNGNVHNIVLRVAVNQYESQDVAVFTVQRFRDGSVQLQLTGDEALYGRNYIIEPYYDDGTRGLTSNPGYIGDNGVAYGGNVTIVQTTPVMIASWPVIHYMYRPGYNVWRSRWYWGYYPVYWNPWKPYYWHYYYGYHYHWNNDYYCHYRRWDTHRYTHWDDHYYHNTRVYSPLVTVNLHAGHYKHTYSHPEERKKGEEGYYRSNPEQGRRATYSTTSSRTSGSNSERSRYTTNSSERNSSTRTATTNRSSSPVTTTTRRASSGTVTTTRSSAPVTATTTRNASSGTVTTTRNSSPGAITSTRKASSTAGDNNEREYRTLKNAGNTRTMANAVTSRSSGQSKSQAVPSERRTTNNDKQVRSTEKNEKSEKSRSSEPSGASRRR